jgi:hypothetical protein
MLKDRGVPGAGPGLKTIPWFGCHVFCSDRFAFGRAVFDLSKHQSLGAEAPEPRNPYAALPTFIREIVDLIASVAKLEVPSNELMFAMRARRSVFPNVDAPWLPRSMTLLVDLSARVKADASGDPIPAWRERSRAVQTKQTSENS